MANQASTNQSQKERASSSYAFVVPRFGPGCGGAETLVSEIALKLHARGDKITILTTCAKDNRSWENAWPAGMTIESGLTVYRYPVDKRNLDIWVPHQISIHEGMNPGLNAQLDWLEHSVNSSELYAHISARADEYDAIFFAPYLFGTTFWGSLIRPDKSILIPCLHDENYSYLESMKGMFALVKGCIFNAKAEMDLAERLFGRLAGGVVGMGFEPKELKECAPYLEEGTKYILYLGRKETGKNGHLLIDNFIRAKESGLIENDLKLAFCGGGSFSDLLRPGVLSRGDILDIGYLSEDEKHRLLSHAVALVQPSRNESFSIVLMEAWLAGVPVIVDALCPVTREHAIDSNGGLYYSTSEEFGLVVNRLAMDPVLRQQLGSAGREYVLSMYDWDCVLSRFDDVVRDVQGIA
jgi:glycosyltransferase involved in cell wall biosynthesis